MPRLFILVITTFFFLSFPMETHSQVKEGQQLNLQQSITLALQNHPSIKAARSTVDINQSRIGQARSNYYPQVNFTSAYDRLNPATQPGGNIVGRGAYDDYRNTFTASQNIYDFGRTSSQVKIQQYNTASSRSDLQDVTDQVIFNVQQTYYALLQAERNRVVAVATVKQFEQHLAQAKGFYEVGTRALFDVTKAEVDLSNAKLNLIRAENSVRLARVNLNNAMGVPNAPNYSIEDNLSYQPYLLTFEEAVKRAYEDRPDLRSIIAKREAAEQSISLARSSYLPFLTGNANYGWTGNNFSEQNSGWDIGASLNVPIFTGFLTKYQVDEAKANLRVFQANEDVLRQNILLSVQQASLNIREAEERITTASLTVKQAEENLNIANGRYQAGVGNPIEVTDALVNYNNAQTAYNQALYDYKVAQASMDRAIGVKY
ncbi:MAG: TolC family protein [Syntrophaceae bacterium]